MSWAKLQGLCRATPGEKPCGLQTAKPEGQRCSTHRGSFHDTLCPRSPDMELQDLMFSLLSPCCFDLILLYLFFHYSLSNGTIHSVPFKMLTFIQRHIPKIFPWISEETLNFDFWIMLELWLWGLLKLDWMHFCYKVSRVRVWVLAVQCFILVSSWQELHIW